MVQAGLVKSIFIVGPTATGKSDLAMQLAKSFDGEIINADSRQFYQELDIGTAKPSQKDLQTLPHHLIDCASIVEPWDVARFEKAANLAIQDCVNRGKLPIIVGGTGLYVRALIWGMDNIPKISEAVRENVRSDFEKLGLEKMYAKLKACDPISAERLEPNDTQRILRALEVFEQTQKPIHEFWQVKKEPKLNALQIAFDYPRDELYARIDARVLKMIEMGLKKEVYDLNQNFPGNVVLNKTIGYQEWLQNGFEKEDLAVAEIQKNSRRFAKRQLTWFRKDEAVHWVKTRGGALELVDKFL